jgi:hypothetical protein
MTKTVHRVLGVASQRASRDEIGKHEQVNTGHVVVPETDRMGQGRIRPD